MCTRRKPPTRKTVVLNSPTSQQNDNRTRHERNGDVVVQKFLIETNFHRLENHRDKSRRESFKWQNENHCRRSAERRAGNRALEQFFIGKFCFQFPEWTNE